MLLRFLACRWWQVGLAVALIAAAAPRFASYDFSLPFVDHPDEPNYYLAGLEWRGLFDNQGYYEGVPPAYIALQAGLQPILETFDVRDLASTTQAMRFLSVCANLATLLFIALAARRIAGNLAAVVAGFAWGLSPQVLENGVYALPDPYVYLFVALALWLAVEALVNPRRSVWSVWSVAAGLLAVLMKYPALPALFPGGVVALWTLVKDRRRGLQLLGAQAVLAGVVAFWLIFIYEIDFANLQREGASVQREGLSNILNAGRVINNLYFAVYPLRPGVFLGLGILGVGAFLIARRLNRPRVDAGGVALCGIVLLTIPWLAASFSHVGLDKIRYVLPATAAVCVLLGAAVQQIVGLLPSRAALPAAVGVASLLFVPQIQPGLEIVQNRRLPDLRVELRRWFDANLDPGTVIVDQDNHKTFNPIWGGIPHRHWVDWWVADNVTEASVEEWRERGMSYAVVPRWQVDNLMGEDQGRAYLSSLLHLRDFYAPPPARGPQMAVYRLWRMEHERQAQFGDAIRLVGYDQSAAVLKPGEELTFRFYWQAAQTPPDNYSLFVHFVPAEAYDVLAQADGSPARPERPTLSWNDPDETLISLPFTLTIPEQLEAGEYRVMIGLYNYTNGQRVLVEGTADSLLLTPITLAEM